MFKSDSPLFVKKKEKGCLLSGLAKIGSVVLEKNWKNKESLQ